MTRYTRDEFEAVGLQPGTCDSGPYGRATQPVTDQFMPGVIVAPEYWFPCPYHEGYIDGYESGRAAGSRQSLSADVRHDDLQEMMRRGEL